MNVGVALREFLLEGFLVVGELGGGGAGGYLVGVNAVAAGDCLVGVSAITADMGVVVVLVAVSVSASALVVVVVPAVIVLAPAAIPASTVATVPVIS